MANGRARCARPQLPLYLTVCRPRNESRHEVIPKSEWSLIC
jgi:hypothetical protein